MVSDRVKAMLQYDRVDIIPSAAKLERSEIFAFISKKIPLNMLPGPEDVLSPNHYHVTSYYISGLEYW